ncbi:MAG: efflux transporter periplasmic adaptor subunit, partial [Sulfurimonas sp. RIFCSPLOWO2_12_FULL_34_6]
IDAVDAPMLLDEAKLLLNKAKNEAKASKNNLESLQAQKSLIQATFNRYEKLIEQKFATGAEYDKAKSDLQNINAQIEASKAQIASAASEEKRVQKSIEAIEAKLDRLKIYSPVDGYVITKEAEQSQYVLPSTAIFKIVDANTLWVKTNIDERLANQIKLNQKASITLRSKPNEKLLGSVDRIVASSNLVTLEREIAVKFDEIPKPFYINEQAEVNIEVADYKNVLKIPLNLLVTNNGKKGVWVARGENAYFESISISAQNDEEVAVSSGIDENTELLIYKPNNKPLSDGMKIFR